MRNRKRRKTVASVLAWEKVANDLVGEGNVADLASRVGVDPGALYKILRGATAEPKFSTAWMLAKVAGITLDDLAARLETADRQMAGENGGMGLHSRGDRESEALAETLSQIVGDHRPSEAKPSRHASKAQGGDQ